MHRITVVSGLFSKLPCNYMIPNKISENKAVIDLKLFKLALGQPGVGIMRLPRRPPCIKVKPFLHS
jgi:hypothetical protein